MKDASKEKVPFPALIHSLKCVCKFPHSPFFQYGNGIISLRERGRICLQAFGEKNISPHPEAAGKAWGGEGK